ncbi:hypothetical protein VE00_04965 [Pseudogymnoascus sp. WSF 3629]|nr:hypothetical protein VE00_04965 [Pseudogymnoascus sp. WSF 3629]
MVVIFGTLGIALLCSVSGITLAAKNPLHARDDACRALAAALAGDVAYPNTTSYLQSADYWSLQQLETQPRCFVAPKSTKEVSTILRVLTEGDWPFTVKGGGHMPFSGGSSIENGVTIDLVHLNDIKVSSDRQSVSVGPGNRWINVTEILDPMGLGVVGGRDMNVGVSGLTLGGGISFFSGMYGWACDNVRRYEVVLASGRIVNATPTENKDLYWALRGGGGSNFGIVTRFDLVIFDQGEVWENGLSFPGSSNATVISHFQNLTIHGMPSDKGATGFVGINYHSSTGGYSADVGLVHATVPSSPGSIPAVFEPFQKVPSATANSTITGTVSNFITSIATPYGRRWTWGNVVVSASFPGKFITEIMSLFESHNVALLQNEGGDDISLTALFQPIPVNLIEAMQKNGGNAMGLKPSNGALIMISFPTSWTEAKNDELAYSATRKLIADIEAKAIEYKVHTPFVYMNYADIKQEVQKGYGKENYARLVKRQKTNATTSADQPDAATSNDLDAAGAVDAMEAVDTVDTAHGEDLYYQQESELLPNCEGLASSLWSLDDASFQWRTPSASSRTSSPQVPYTFDAMLENNIIPNPSYLDITFEGLFDSDLTDAESHQRYCPQPVAFWAESKDGALAMYQRRLLPSGAATPPAVNTPSSASLSPPYPSPANSYSPGGSSSISRTSSMGQLFATQPSDISYQTSPTRIPLLHVAIRTRKKSMIRLLLRRGVSTINEQDSDGRTALHVAVQSGDEEMVETLMKHGADPKAVDKHGLDALHFAVKQGHEEIVEILLDALAPRIAGG